MDEFTNTAARTQQRIEDSLAADRTTVVELTLPTPEMQTAYLKKLATERGLTLSDGAAHMLASHSNSSFTSLARTLRSVAFYALHTSTTAVSHLDSALVAGLLRRLPPHDPAFV